MSERSTNSSNGAPANQGNSHSSEAGPSTSSSTNGHHHHASRSSRFSNGGGTNGEGGSGSSFLSNGESSLSAPAERQAETADYVGFRPIYEGSRIDRRELVRLTLQSLRELGYENAAKSLENEAGITLEHPSITAFRSAVLDGDWRNSERLLVDGLTYAAQRRPHAKSSSSNEIVTPVDFSTVLRDTRKGSLDSIRFMLQEQRYLELLESGQTKKALSVLRERLTPLSHGSDKLHQLSSLVMCNSVQQLRSRADWDGAGLSSRRKLLHAIELSISPNVMLSSRRLPYLLEQAQTLQKHLDPFFNLPQDSHVSLYTDYHSDKSIFPSVTTHILRGHHDEVWVMAFSHDGRYLATGSKDKSIVVWKVSPERCEKIKSLGPHTGEVSTLAWSPDDSIILSASDTEVYQWDWQNTKVDVHREHKYTVYAAAWLPDGQGFVTGGTDGQVIFWDRLGQITHIWTTSPFRVLALTVTPDGKYVVAVSWRSIDNSLVEPSSGANANGLGNSNRSGLHRASSTTTTTTSSSLHSSYSPSESPSPISTSGHYPEASSRRAEGRRGGGSISGPTSSRLRDDQRSKLHLFNLSKKQEEEGILMAEEMMSVAVSSDSRYVLINQRPNEAQLWNLQDKSLVATYTGQRVSRDMIRCCFGGSEESFIATGSEDSIIYIYHRNTGKLLERLVGHGPGSVNTVAWHPKLPSLLASCGDDGTIRIWQPASSTRSSATQPSTAAEEDEAVIDSMTGSLGASSSSATVQTTLPTFRRFGPSGIVFGASEAAAMSVDSLTGGVAAGEAGDSGQVPFPWSMSPARPASPEEDVPVTAEQD